jgi:hypothetical protein
MRRLALLAIMLFLGSLAQAAPAATAKVGPPEQALIRQTLERYEQAMEEGNWSALQAVCTPNFLANAPQGQGSEEGRWAEFLKQQRGKHVGAKFEDFRFVRKNRASVLAQYSTVEKGETQGMGGKWFVLVKDKRGAWRVDGFREDYYPSPP